ncbi:MAG: hypothetical protein N5P05_004259 (plasmid) [Chroococcopsis gigantea SAG 12.99]|jgi:hypothetical protein|nr:hypothetical protein [Chroococcopsis gigantea SAG 12.99]
MARTVPLTLRFFARFLNIGNMGETIKKSIAKIQDRERKGINDFGKALNDKVKISLNGKDAQEKELRSSHGVKIPDDSIIPDDKITKYLLIYKERDDKSKYLAQGGFTIDNPEQLKRAIYELIKTNLAIQDRTNDYGAFYKVTGELIGVNGINLPVTTIWLQRRIDGQFQFITLKPTKENKYRD